ncbi:prephenate dehydrogenase [Solihabitans fulvus]|uniref:Prephenate dehydrogenase n=1 Tax=Solihabitans fulvus TaxID=1892852 RepID=A0A5B2XH64_9PSEU|nr:prephenate dehydrogenase [Solihabitans fulvus]KAA2262190.1 prephenate dehydrogenase [Solihabitans fulvus]
MGLVGNVCVVGLGLIGGSVLRAAAGAGHSVWGTTASAADASAAAADGFDVGTDAAAALRRAAERDALVVLAVPLPSVGDVLRLVTEHAPGCRLTDVVSVKEPVAEAVRRFAPSARYVGGHPMAGTSASGWAAGSAGLFADAAWVVAAEDGGDPSVLREVTALALDCGAHVVPATAAEHDAAVARISHLPHVLAAVLAAVGADGGPLALALAAGSFGDGTRVAGSRVELVRAMCEGNRSALLDAVDDALGRLGAARGSLASTGSLGKTLEAGHAGRLALTEQRAAARTPLRIDLTAPDAMAALRALGSRGGRITALDGAVALAETT